MGHYWCETVSIFIFEVIYFIIHQWSTHTHTHTPLTAVIQILLAFQAGIMSVVGETRTKFNRDKNQCRMKSVCWLGKRKKVSVKIIHSLTLVMTSNDVIRRNWNVFSITHFRYNRLMSSSEKARAHSNCIALSQRARETVKERETEKKRMKSFLLIISLLLFLFSPRASPYSNRSWIFLDSGKTCIDATQ